MAKRVSSLNANWAFIMENMFPLDKPKILPVKMLADKYTREVSSKPSELPEINWSSYKSRIPQADKLNAIQKAYESFKVPYPTDQAALGRAESTNAKILEKTKKYLEILTTDLKAKEAELAELDSVMKYSEMTMEEFFLAYPNHRIDPTKPNADPWPQLHMKKFFLERMLSRGATLDGEPLTEEVKHALEERLQSGDY